MAARAIVPPMNVALLPPWTTDRFLEWAGRQDAPYEFDGIRPVAMTGGNANHSRITTNIHAALRSRLRGMPCSFFGPDLGVRTIGDAIRYPDALITCTRFAGTERLAPDVVVIFEVLSPTSGQTDRIGKIREYAAIPSLRRYVIVESTSAGLLVLHRSGAQDPWSVVALTGDDILTIPEIGLTIPVAECYEDVTFDDPAPAGA